MKKKISLCLGIGVLLLASCSGEKTTTITSTLSNDTTSKTTTKKKETIKQYIIGTTASIENAVYGEYNYDMLASGVSEIPMIYQDSNGSYHDLLCTYKTEDSVSWTYTVKDGMTFSDGVKVTAEDILFTLEYEDKNGSANLVDQTDSDGKVTKKKYTDYSISEDKKSITLTLATANVRELSNMTSFRIAPKHILENKENPTAEDLRITAGPYVLDSFNKSSGTLKFKKNSYYPEEVNVDTILYQLYSSEDAMYIALQNGEIDSTWAYSSSVSATYLDLLESSMNVVTVAQTNAPAVLAFNNAKGVFSDENLRIAVSYALDYEQFKTTFGTKYASLPNRGFVPSSTFGYKETEKNSKNLEKAKEYLAKSGYTAKNRDGFYTKDGAELGFTLTVNSSKAAHVRYAELVKTNLESFGIRCTIESLDSTAYNKKTSNKFSENNITMEAAIYGYTSAGMGMMAGLGTIYVNGNHAVQGGCQVFDVIFQNALAELTAAKTVQEYETAAGKVQDYYKDRTPLIALYNDSLSYVYSKKYKGLEADMVFGLNSIPNWSKIEKK